MSIVECVRVNYRKKGQKIKNNEVPFFTDYGILDNPFVDGRDGLSRLELYKKLLYAIWERKEIHKISINGKEIDCDRFRNKISLLRIIDNLVICSDKKYAMILAKFIDEKRAEIQNDIVFVDDIMNRDKKLVFTDLGVAKFSHNVSETEQWKLRTSHFTKPQKLAAVLWELDLDLCDFSECEKHVGLFASRDVDLKAYTSDDVQHAFYLLQLLVRTYNKSLRPHTVARSPLTQDEGDKIIKSAMKKAKVSDTLKSSDYVNAILQVSLLPDKDKVFVEQYIHTDKWGFNKESDEHIVMDVIEQKNGISGVRLIRRCNKKGVNDDIVKQVVNKLLLKGMAHITEERLYLDDK